MIDVIQNYVDPLSGKVLARAVPTRATATAADAVDITRDMCLLGRRSGDSFPDVLPVVVDRDPKFKSDVFRAFVNGIIERRYYKKT